MTGVLDLGFVSLRSTFATEITNLECDPLRTFNSLGPGRNDRICSFVLVTVSDQGWHNNLVEPVDDGPVLEPSGGVELAGSTSVSRLVP